MKTFRIYLVYRILTVAVFRKLLMKRNYFNTHTNTPLLLFFDINYNFLTIYIMSEGAEGHTHHRSANCQASQSQGEREKERKEEDVCQ